MRWLTTRAAAAGPGPAERPTSGQRSSISHELGRLGVEDPEERLGVLSRLTGRVIDDMGALTRAEAGKAAAALKGCGGHSDLVKLYDAAGWQEAGE